MKNELAIRTWAEGAAEILGILTLTYIGAGVSVCSFCGEKFRTLPESSGAHADDCKMVNFLNNARKLGLLK